jgi:hypothetical protein
MIQDIGHPVAGITRGRGAYILAKIMFVYDDRTSLQEQCKQQEYRDERQEFFQYLNFLRRFLKIWKVRKENFHFVPDKIKIRHTARLPAHFPYKLFAIKYLRIISQLISIAFVVVQNINDVKYNH